MSETLLCYQSQLRTTMRNQSTRPLGSRCFSHLARLILPAGPVCFSCKGATLQTLSCAWAGRRLRFQCVHRSQNRSLKLNSHSHGENVLELIPMGGCEIECYYVDNTPYGAFAYPMEIGHIVNFFVRSFGSSLIESHWQRYTSHMPGEIPRIHRRSPASTFPIQAEHLPYVRKSANRRLRTAPTYSERVTLI